MKFARFVFLGAGIYGLIALLPQYFLKDRIGLDQHDLVAVHTASGIALVHGQLHPAEALVAQQGEAATERIERAELEVGRMGHGRGECRDARQRGSGLHRPRSQDNL